MTRRDKLAPDVTLGGAHANVHPTNTQPAVTELNWSLGSLIRAGGCGTPTSTPVAGESVGPRDSDAFWSFACVIMWDSWGSRLGPEARTQYGALLVSHPRSASICPTPPPGQSSMQSRSSHHAARSSTPSSALPSSQPSLLAPSAMKCSPSLGDVQVGGISCCCCWRGKGDPPPPQSARRFYAVKTSPCVRRAGPCLSARSRNRGGPCPSARSRSRGGGRSSPSKKRTAS